jgi:hypothetical protein
VSLEPRAYPNPSQGQARVRYTLPETALVRLEVYDILGRRVRVLTEGVRTSGRQETILDLRGFASGVYFVRFQLDHYIAVRQMLAAR